MLEWKEQELLLELLSKKTITYGYSDYTDSSCQTTYSSSKFFNHIKILVNFNLAKKIIIDKKQHWQITPDGIARASIIAQDGNVPDDIKKEAKKLIVVYI